MDQSFDVFLSHNSSDKPAVVELAEALKDRGLRPWLDLWELAPGRPWQEALEAIIETVPASAILIGRDGLGPWQRPEMRGCLAEFVARNQPVIPVLLPGAPTQPRLPLFLRDFTWVDLRGGLSRGLDRLVWGITGEKLLPETPGRELAPPRPPALHNLSLTSLGGQFKGRTQLLTQLAADFELAPATAVVQPEVIHGLGGIGKTRLALEYAWRTGDHYSAAFFLPAASPEDLKRGLSALAGPKILNLELEGFPEEKVIESVLGWLGRNPGWLMILDNVDTEDAALAVRELLPDLSAGHVLVTSRIARWAAGVRELEVDKLEPDAAVDYLLARTDGKRRHRRDDERRARELAELLDGLPLALEQAAAYIASQYLSFEEYSRSWNIESSEMMSWYDKGELTYPRSLAVTWKHTFDQLRSGSRTLLRLLSYLSTDPVPAEMLFNGREIIFDASKIGLSWWSSMAGLMKARSKVDIKASLEEISKYSLATRDGDHLSIHRMVLEVVRGQIPVQHRQEWLGRAVQLVYQFSPAQPGDVRTWPIWDLLRPHAARVIELAEHTNTEAVSSLISQLATLLYAKSLHHQAEPLMRRALEIDERSFGEEHPNVAIDLNNLAQLLQATNRLSEAEPLMRRALEIFVSSLGEDHPSTLTVQGNLDALLEDMAGEAET